jgi:hypothetical protein
MYVAAGVCNLGASPVTLPNPFPLTIYDIR